MNQMSNLNLMWDYQAVGAKLVNVPINHLSMLKVKGSNPGASIFKFGLFQFSKWLCLDKNENLWISVALLILNDWTTVNAKSYSEQLHGF